MLLNSVRVLRRAGSTFRNLSSKSSFWQWTTKQRPSWREDYKEAAVVFCVFGITGSTSVALVRPALKKIGIEGTLVDGPWDYRILSILIVSPIYAAMLITFGTLAGRHNFFAYMGLKIFGRFLPKSISNRLACTPGVQKLMKKE